MKKKPCLGVSFMCEHTISQLDLNVHKHVYSKFTYSNLARDMRLMKQQRYDQRAKNKMMMIKSAFFSGPWELCLHTYAHTPKDI